MDVFFVLSGYLITSLLVIEHQQCGRISLIAFYRRRAARLYPALIVMLFICVPAAFTLTGGLRLAAGNALLAATYTTDLSSILRVHGWAPTSHTWSLAVEEQFYLLWPMVFLGAPRKLRRRLVIVSSIVGATSIIAMAVTMHTIASLSAWYPLPSNRAWELLAGCLLASTGRRYQAPALAASGLALLVATVALSNVAGVESTPVMMCEIAAAVTGTLLVLAGRSGRVHKALSCKPLVNVGARSYGLYLFHIPLLYMPFGLGLQWRIRIPLCMAATGLLAWASFRWIEKPVQQWASRSSSQAIVSIASPEVTPSDQNGLSRGFIDDPAVAVDHGR